MPITNDDIDRVVDFYEKSKIGWIGFPGGCSPGFSLARNEANAPKTTLYAFRFNRRCEDQKKAVEIYVDGKLVGYADWFAWMMNSDETEIVAECGVLKAVEGEDNA